MSFKMLTRVFRIAIENSNITKKTYSPSYQLLSSKFSTGQKKSHENVKKTEKNIKTETSKLGSSLSLRRQKLPDYPTIDYVYDLKRDRFLPSSFKVVQHGDYQFQTCLEDYVQVYASGYQMRIEPNACGGYAVYYAENHPLNESGPVDRRQGLHHTKMFGFLRALKSIPTGLFPKVSINLDDKGLCRFFLFSLPLMSENAFRSVYSGKLNKDLETSMEINTLLRTRQDLTFRIQYTPRDICFPPAKRACDMAKRASYNAQRQRQKTHLSDEM